MGSNLDIQEVCVFFSRLALKAFELSMNVGYLDSWRLTQQIGIYPANEDIPNKCTLKKNIYN
jgi:hypothetical protein